MKKIAYLYCLSLVLLTACAPPKEPTTNEVETTKSQPTLHQTAQTKTETVVDAMTQKQSTTSTPTSFTLSGAIAAKNHQKGWTAMVNWRQSGPHTYQITLIGPMGSQAVRIEEHRGIVTYQEGAKKLSSSNGDDLLAKKTDIHLPVNNLYYWVRGLPAPGSIQSIARDSNGRLKNLKQSGYTIEFTEYMTNQTHALPRKIRLYGKDLTVKLVIKHWR